MGWSLLKILHANCDPKMAEDKSLPYTAYLVHYMDDNGETPKYDIVIADSQVRIFDYYYDLYKKGFKSLKQTDGMVNPRLWTTAPSKNSKKENKPKRKAPPST